MNIKQRMQRILLLEKRTAPKVNHQIFVYFHDKEEGYAANSLGPYYETFEDLAAAQNWQVGEHDTLINVTYTEPPTAVYIPDNGRG